MEKKYIDSRRIADIVLLAIMAVFFIMVAISFAASGRISTKTYLYRGIVGRGDVMELVNSSDELKAAINVNNDIADKYDDKFFEKNSLIIYDDVCISAIGYSAVVGVYKENDVLLLDIYQHRGSAIPEMNERCTVFLEVKKSAIKGATRVELANKD